MTAKSREDVAAVQLLDAAQTEAIFQRLVEELRRNIYPRDRSPAAQPKGFPALSPGQEPGRVLSSVQGRILGWSLRETTGLANATIELRDGRGAGDDLIFPLTLSPNETSREWFGGGGANAAHGIAFSSGLFLVRLAGNVDGAVFLGDL